LFFLKTLRIDRFHPANAGGAVEPMVRNGLMAPERSKSRQRKGEEE
jgi:hypothetical protein